MDDVTGSPTPDAAFLRPAPPPPGKRLALRLAGPAAVAAGVLAATAYVGTVDPNEPGHYPLCPTLQFTGLFCPGCGGLRCVHALASADIPAALGFNAFAVAMVPLLVFIWLRWTVRSARGQVRMSAADPRLVKLLLAGIAVFTVLRNLPFGTWLAP
ncbi:DUF2752 domain-containing protein [Yinghuangia soli]|uniref:DUF2752 domain-containing protein n=1 Tax=Yinghuangia soli TaxID=2908204 RepID=A0AA41Q2L1_9ACTN|nr:DUF2752 domain-containing protein [Yinghuangia soli]MCF2530423.1 DUF2752 domain-containing protein [Yinghuangia soli]